MNGQQIVLEEQDLLIEPVQKEGYAVEVDGDFAVIIDTHITPELEEEGNVREIISKIQTHRKEAGFEVTDHIRISFAEGDDVMEIVKRNEESIMKETLGDSISYGELTGYAKQWDINGKDVTIALEKI